MSSAGAAAPAAPAPAALSAAGAILSPMHDSLVANVGLFEVQGQTQPQTSMLSVQNRPASLNAPPTPSGCSVGPFSGAIFAVPFHLFFRSDWVSPCCLSASTVWQHAGSRLVPSDSARC